jgi:hypothetical protein
MAATPSSLENILNEIKRTFDGGYYHAAITMALSIPDICVTLQSKEARSGPSAYQAWLKQYMFDGEDSYLPPVYYKLRCGVAHNAFFSHTDLRKMGFERVVFTLPNRGQGVHRIAINEALFLMSECFIDEMIEAAHKWYAANKRHPNVRKHQDKLIQMRSAGYKNYVSGLPVLA